MINIAEQMVGRRSVLEKRQPPEIIYRNEDSIVKVITLVFTEQVINISMIKNNTNNCRTFFFFFLKVFLFFGGTFVFVCTVAKSK